MSASAGTCNAQLEEHEPGVVPQSRGRNRKEDGAFDDLIGQNTLKTAIQNSLPLSELGTPTTTVQSTPSTAPARCRAAAWLQWKSPEQHGPPPPPRSTGTLCIPRSSAVAHRQGRRSLWLWLFLTPRMCVPLTHITRPVALHPFCVVADDPQGMLGSSRQEGDGLVVDEYEAHSTKSFHTFHTDTILHLMQVGISRIRPIEGSCSHRRPLHGRNAQAVRRTGRSVPGRIQTHIEEKGLCSRVASEMCSKPPLVPR
ncbi:hypothetical protein CTAM01_13764 [Colletotrichum tamarilloi]|uniref:Uncharacterized protein n=1 Tax=Colletotrichum tamarilloi TaxID=1209934 RepID=A0ABQ9QR87_9PEZI|nr:uncharacterized protein CTAM01_13764 [Colletotrichum tamarilloi]KAK1482050.1 hypothetical protein CTAM01_13764 [Colletotrichum tamarilloi]